MSGPRARRHRLGVLLALTGLFALAGCGSAGVYADTAVP